MRAVLLVVDGLGVGAMDDVPTSRPQDRGANTLLHVAERVGGLDLPTLWRLGLGNVLAVPGLSAAASPLASWGQAELAYPGADSYLGHQELMGTIPAASRKTLMREAGPRITAALEAAGHRVRRPLPDLSLLLVDEAVVVADNIEADAGQIVNLTVPTGAIAFERALEIGQLIRSLLETSRVIVFGGPRIGVDDILAHVEVRDGGRAGVNSPRLGVYDADLQVRHLGYGVDPARQLAMSWAAMGEPVALYGKMADLVECPAAERDPLVATAQVLVRTRSWLAEHPRGLVAANVQETDLAGHELDARRYAAELALVDRGLAELLPLLGPDDVLVLAADHGNDPTLGTHQHTRERVPLLCYRPGVEARPIGRRRTLADVAATLAHLAGIPWRADGTSWA